MSAGCASALVIAATNDNAFGWHDSDLSGHKIETEGYIISYCPKHPHARSNGYVLFHRLVMENFLKRYLGSDENVHHINGVKNDNRLENLKVMAQSEYSTHHLMRQSEGDKKRRTSAMVEYQKNRATERKIVECACGCGQTFETPTRYYCRQKKYVVGHATRGKHLTGPGRTYVG